MNYETPIDVAEGRLSSNTAFSSSTSDSKSDLLIVAVVLAVIFVFGGILTAAVAVLIKRKKDQLFRNDHQEDHLRSKTLIPADENQSGFELQPDVRVAHELPPDVRAAHPLGPDVRAAHPLTPDVGATHRLTHVDTSFLCQSTFKLEPQLTPGAHLLPTISSTGVSMKGQLHSIGRSSTPRERIVRTIPHEPPDPDILLYSLKSSGE